MEENPRFLPIVSTHRILFHFLILFHDFEGRKMKQNAVGTVIIMRNLFVNPFLVEFSGTSENKQENCYNLSRELHCDLHAGTFISESD